MPSARITIRLSAILAARLRAKTGPRGTLADTVRHAIEAYIQDPAPLQLPPSTTVAAMAATAAASTDILAAIQERLGSIEARLTALEALAATGRRERPPRQLPQPTPQMQGAYDVGLAVQRIKALRQQRLSYEQIAQQLTVEGIPTRYGLPWQHSSVRYLDQRDPDTPA